MLKDYVCGLFEGQVWSSGGAHFDRFGTAWGKKKGTWDLARAPQAAVKTYV